MKLSKQNRIIGLTAFVFVTIATGLYAAPQMHDRIGYEGMGFGHHDMNPMHLMMMAEKLELTEAQRKSLGDIIDKNQPKMRETMFALMDSKKELKSLMKQDKINDKKLRELTTKQGQLIGEMMYQRMKTQLDLRALLTDQQRIKMDELRKKSRMHFKGRDFSNEGPMQKDEE